MNVLGPSVPSYSQFTSINQTELFPGCTNFQANHINWIF